MSKIVTFLIFGAVLFICMPSMGSACSCDNFPSHEEEFKSAKAVFVGRVLAIDKQLPIPKALDGQFREVAYAIRLEVEKSWKGQKRGQIVVWLHGSSLHCSRWEFQPNERYLIYANEYKRILIVNSWCSRTRPLERIYEDSIREYKELDSLRAKKSNL